MTDREAAIECLKQLSPARAKAYESWLAVGMALHASGATVDDWIAWCPDGKKNHEATCRTKWRGFGKADGKIGIASLVKWCKDDGGKPPRTGHRGADIPDAPLTWETPVGPGMAEQAGAVADYAEPVPEAGPDPVADLVTYLELMFQENEKVSYVLGSFKDEDDKFKPMGKGVYTRTRAEIVADLRRYAKKAPEKAIENALGSWDPDAGGWVRINPVDGAGVTNEAVARLDHVLVESDAMPMEMQLSTIHSLQLPCTAIVHSGGKSVHAIVRVDAGTDRALYRERVEKLFTRLAEAGFVVDRQCRNPSRLSRLPGLTRAGKRQYLVSGPCGAVSWDEWDSLSRADEYSAEILGPDQIDAELPDDNLLGERFLTRGGSWLLVAQSGIGKSVLAVQGAVSFAVGRPLFGLVPVAPMRQLIIQAENNGLDVQEMFQGVTAGMQLTADERRALRNNLRIVPSDSLTGGEFCTFTGWLCDRIKPDIVWIDPLLAYIGGEISKMADCSRFLRNQLNPVIRKHNVGVVVIHHTGKPPKNQENAYKGADMAYLGIGSSDLTNWARATSTIMQIEDYDNRYELRHAKRGRRAGCQERTELQHANEGICWVAAAGHPVAKEVERQKKQKNWTKAKASKYDDMGFELMPPRTNDNDPQRSELIKHICQTMDDRGEPTDLKRADNIRRVLSRAGIIVFDKEGRTWQGNLYSPSF
jgi:RecA-family ATPase